jgi:hypothetical protein
MNVKRQVVTTVDAPIRMSIAPGALLRVSIETESAGNVERSAAFYLAPGQIVDGAWTATGLGSRICLVAGDDYVNVVAVRDALTLLIEDAKRRDSRRRRGGEPSDQPRLNDGPSGPSYSE